MCGRWREHRNPPYFGIDTYVIVSLKTVVQRFVQRQGQDIVGSNDISSLQTRSLHKLVCSFNHTDVRSCSYPTRKTETAACDWDECAPSEDNVPDLWDSFARGLCNPFLHISTYFVIGSPQDGGFVLQIAMELGTSEGDGFLISNGKIKYTWGHSSQVQKNHPHHVSRGILLGLISRSAGRRDFDMIKP